MPTGTVQRYWEDIKMGRIAGPEREFIFRRQDWLSPAEPAIGLRVEFEAIGERAVKIRIVETENLQTGTP